MCTFFAELLLALTSLLAFIMPSVETQVKAIRQRLQSHGAMFVAGFCRENIKKLKLEGIPLDIVQIIIAQCSAIECWNSELTGKHILVIGKDHESIKLAVRGAQSAYGMLPIDGSGIHRWKIKIAELKMDNTFEVKYNSVYCMMERVRPHFCR